MRRHGYGDDGYPVDLPAFPSYTFLRAAAGEAREASRKYWDGPAGERHPVIRSWSEKVKNDGAETKHE